MLARVCVSVGMKMAMKSFLLSSKSKSCCVFCPNLDLPTPQMKIHIASSLKKFITVSLPNRSKLQSFRIIFHHKLKAPQRILFHSFKCLVCPIPVAFRKLLRWHMGALHNAFALQVFQVCFLPKHIVLFESCRMA